MLPASPALRRRLVRRPSHVLWAAARGLALFTLAAGVAACSGDDEPTPPPPPTPAITLAVSPATTAIMQGQSGTVTATVGRTNYTGAVAITVEGAPTGVTVTPTPASLTGTTNTASIAIAPSATAAPGTYTLTVRAAGTGVAAQTATVALTVGAATPPSITLALNSTDTLRVAQGATGTRLVTITRELNYTGAVDLTVEGLPANVTAAFAPATIASGATQSTLTFTVGANATPGATAVTVRARGTGIAERTTTVPLLVTAAAPAPGYTVALAPAAVSLAAGGTATSTLNLTRTGGFAGAVTVTTSGAPAGLTVTPASGSVTGNSVVLNVAATAAVTPGTYNVTVRGAATGQTDQTATLAVTVTAPTPTPGYTLALAPAAVTVQQGANATSTLNLTRTGGFTGAVAVTTSGAPAGLTVTPATASVTENSVVLTAAATAAVAPGTYQVTVRGTATGMTDQTATLAVTVTAAPGSFTLTVAPTTVTVQQGQTTTATVTIARTGSFTGAVDVTVSGLPAGVTAEVVTALAAARAPRGVAAAAIVPITGTTATIRLTAAANAAPTTANITVTGTAAGQTTRTATVGLTVTQAPVGGVGFAFCTGDIPTFVAYQSSEGAAWTRATVNANGTVSLPLAGPRSGVAFIQQVGVTTTMNVVYGTPAELTTYGASVCQVAAGGKRVTGTVTGLGQLETATITLGSSTASVSGATGNAFTLTNVPPGPRDLLATRAVFSLSTGSINVNRGLIRRNVNVADGAALAPIDFAGPESFAPATANLTIGNMGSDIGFPVVSYQTANGASGTFFTGINGLVTGTPTATQQYAGVPAANQAAGDFHVVAAVAFPGPITSPDATNLRMAGAFFRTVADRTVTLGPQLTAPTVSVATSAPYVRPRVQLARQAEYADAMTATFAQGGATIRSASITVLSSYVGNGAWDVTLPDLSGVAGFDPNWGLRPGTPITWSVSASGGNISVYVGGTPTEGSTFRSATRTGTTAALLRARFGR